MLIPVPGALSLRDELGSNEDDAADGVSLADVVEHLLVGVGDGVQDRLVVGVRCFGPDFSGEELLPVLRPPLCFLLPCFLGRGRGDFSYKGGYCNSTKTREREGGVGGGVGGGVRGWTIEQTLPVSPWELASSSSTFLDSIGLRSSSITSSMTGTPLSLSPLLTFLAATEKNIFFYYYYYNYCWSWFYCCCCFCC